MHILISLLLSPTVIKEIGEIFSGFSILCANYLKLYFAYSGDSLNICCNNEFLLYSPHELKNNFLYYMLKNETVTKTKSCYVAVFVPLFA